jgi:hypothetical protein
MSVIVAAESLPRGSAVRAARALTDSEHTFDRIRRAQILAARAAGVSWQQIGDTLDVTSQLSWWTWNCNGAAGS